MCPAHLVSGMLSRCKHVSKSWGPEDRNLPRRSSRGIPILLGAFLLAILQACFAPAASASCSAPQNAIEAENCLPGSGAWGSQNWEDPSIAGFTTDISVNAGQTVFFKINTNAKAYTMDIYRMGYYGGNGARKITSISPSVPLPQTQPACLTDSKTGLVDCGNWAVTASWTVPSNAVSGVYLTKLVRSDTGGYAYVIFIVRNDSSHSDLMFQTSDLTWQAYNTFGGNSFYQGSPDGRAYKLSYNRPVNTRGVQPYSYFFGEEYSMIRFLERNGYDMTYSSGVDTDRYGSLMLNHKVFLSVGHDEYWSGGQRTNAEAARNAGVHLAFFSGNEVWWKTRWENAIDGTQTAYRTLVCYKESWAGAVIDPADPPTSTGAWGDPRYGPPADGGRPGNSLTGTYYSVNSTRYDSIQVPADDGKMRFWRNTLVASQSLGQVATLPAQTLGYEWDVDKDNGFRPAGLIHLSTATYTVNTLDLGFAGIETTGSATHHMTLYKHPSGALVFGAGSVFYSWGLDDNHDTPGPLALPPDPNLQQATINLLADMGAQPATLMSGMIPAVASSDFVPPSSTITFPTSGAILNTQNPITVTGTAVDFGGGVVGDVEVSIDGGATWHPATGRESWSYIATLPAGPITIKSRAADDSGNIEVPSPGITVNGSSTGLTISSVSLNPSSVVGGSSSIGTVTLTGSAPAGGAAVALSSNDTAAAVPPSVTVPAGAITATFTVTTTVVGAVTTPTITATYNGTSTAPLTVTSAALVAIAVTPANSSIAKNATQQFTATGTYSNSSTQNITSSVTWTSSSTRVAKISSAGLASGVATGSATIKAASGSVSGSTVLTVTAVQSPDFTLTPLPASQSVVQGASTIYTGTIAATGGFSGVVGLTLSGLPTGATGTFNPASVTGSGTSTLTVTTAATTPTGTSTVTVTGTSGSLTHSATVSLVVLSSSSPTLTSIAVTPASNSIAVGGTQQYLATGTYSDSSTQNLTNSVTWTSSTPAAATINAAGLATAVATGSTTVKAAFGAVSGTAALTVTSASSGLVGHWTFDAGSGTTAVDSSGSGYTTTLFNGVTWVPGKIGNAISANTTNQYASTAAINLSAASAVTVAAWVNRTYTSGGTNGNTLWEFSSNFNNVSNAFAFFPDEAPDCGVTAMEIGIGGNVGYNIKCYAQPTSGVWHHLAVVYDMSQTAANEVSLYIDGVLQTALKQTNSSNNTGTFGTYPLYLFSRGGTTSFSGGQMDDLQIYNRQLTTAEIQQIYGAGSATLASIAVTPANPSIAKGTTQQFTATATYSDGSTQNITGSATWSSTSSSVAIVTSGGLATGVATGSVTIQAASGSISGSTGLTVTPPVLVSIAVTPASSSIAKNSTQQFTATGIYSDSSTQNITGSVTWASTTPAVATINSAGLASGVAAGSTTIQATSGSIIGSTGMTVTPPPLVSIAVTPANPSIAKGRTQQFTATGTYSDSSTLNITSSVIWASTTTTVATINSAGLANGVAAGSTTIQATSGSISGSTALTVTPPVLVSMAVTPANVSILSGGTQQFTATGTYSDNSTQNLSNSVTWSSTNSGVATITNVGLASGVAAGGTIIQAVSGSITGSTGLTVATVPVLVSIAVTPANPSIAVAGTQQFTATGTYSDSSTQNLTNSVTWTSSTPAAATINAAGLATAVAAGSTTIKAASGAVSGSTALTVTSTLSGLVGHWTFDAGSGTTAVDSSGSGYAASLFNGVTWVPGKIGNAISANTTNQYASTAAINLSATSAVTVAAWVNRTYTSGGTNGNTLWEFSSNFNNVSNGFAFFPDEAPDCGITAMEIGIDGNVGYNIKCYAQPTSGVWHHLVVVYDMSQTAANEVSFYIDGVLQTALKQTNSSNNTGKFGTYPLYLFSRGGTTSFSGGQMDDLQIFNRHLTAAEIQALP